MELAKWVKEWEKEKKRILSVAEATEISKKFLISYKRNTIMYATMILDLIETRNVEVEIPVNEDSTLNESEVEHCFFQHMKYTGLNQHQLKAMKLPPNHVILCDEKFACIWAQYVFLVVTNRHPKYTPKMITLHGRTKEILPLTPFDGFSKNCRQVSEELEKNARDLLDNASNDAAGPSISYGILHYMVAFSRWMIIMDDVKEHKNCETFVSEITEWCNLKRSADAFVKLDKEEFQAGNPWAGCAEWLASMDCFATSKGRKLNCRPLCDSLQTLETRE